MPSYNIIYVGLRFVLWCCRRWSNMSWVHNWNLQDGSWSYRFHASSSRGSSVVLLSGKGDPGYRFTALGLAETGLCLAGKTAGCLKCRASKLDGPKLDTQISTHQVNPVEAAEEQHVTTKCSRCKTHENPTLGFLGGGVTSLESWQEVFNRHGHEQWPKHSVFIIGAAIEFQTTPTYRKLQSRHNDAQWWNYHVRWMSVFNEQFSYILIEIYLYYRVLWVGEFWWLGLKRFGHLESSFWMIFPCFFEHRASKNTPGSSPTR